MRPLDQRPMLFLQKRLEESRTASLAAFAFMLYLGRRVRNPYPVMAGLDAREGEGALRSWLPDIEVDPVFHVVHRMSEEIEATCAN